MCSTWSRRALVAGLRVTSLAPRRDARISVLSMTARKRITPWKVNVQLESHCAPMIPIETIPSIAAPKAAPITDP